MCCHQHPDNGHGLALERVDSPSMPPWTLEELRELFDMWHEEEECEDCHSVDDFFRWLGEQ